MEMFTSFTLQILNVLAFTSQNPLEARRTDGVEQLL